MSDDRFTYIHLPHETSLWSYVDDQVDWAVQSLEDRFDQEVWDLIPPYQNEDDEGLLPSNAHPSYPYGNPYESNRTSFTRPSHARLPLNSLASGTSLLAAAATPLEPFHPEWQELAVDNLLWPDPGNRPPAGQSQSEDVQADYADGNPHQAPESANRPPAGPAGLHTQPRTPVGTDRRRSRRADDEDLSDWEEGPSAESDSNDIAQPRVS